jgi:hypothetical protein
MRRQEDQEAEAFAAAWFLPARLVHDIPDDASLAAQSRTSQAEVRARRADLAGRVVELREPPTWSAWHNLVLNPRSGEACCRRFHYRPMALAPGEKPVFIPKLLPTGTISEAEARQADLDLWALTATQFFAKYGSRTDG